MVGWEALIEVGGMVGIALVGSVLSYIKGAARSDERWEASRAEYSARKEYLDNQISEIKARHDKDNSETKLLIAEFRQSLATIYNEKSDIRVDVAQNYLSKQDFNGALERISLQVNTYQLNNDQRMRNLESSRS